MVKVGMHNGGAGGVGRIRMEYCETLGGNANPSPTTAKLTCHVVEQIESTPYTSGRLNLPETFTGGRTYAVQYGRKLKFDAAGQQVPSLRIPAGLQSSTNLQFLASGLSGSTAASIDVGNDSSVEWSNTVANNSTTDLPDLSAAFNAYWAASGAPATGTIDVPVRVTSGGAGQFLLTNLRTTSAASRLRHLYLPAQSYTKFLLDLSVGDAGQAGVTAAVDLGDNGSIDWHTPAAGPGPARWTTGDLAAALNAYLAGKSGTVDVPVRIYVSPSGSAILNGYTAAAAPLADLAASTPTVGSAGRRHQRRHVRSVGERRRHGTRGHDPAQLRQRRQRPSDRRLLCRRPQLGRLVPGQRLRRQPRRRCHRACSARLEYAQLRRRHRRQGRRQSLRHDRRNQPGQQHGHLPITVVPLHPAPVVDFSATARTGGAPLSVSFTDLTTGEVTSRSWQFGDGATATVANPVHTYTSIGTYTVTLSAEGPGGSDWERKTAYIVVTDEPVSPTAAFAGSPTSGTVPLAVQFTDQSSGTITGRSWSFGDGQTSTAQSPAHTYTAAGLYSVSLAVTGPGGTITETKTSYITASTPTVTPTSTPTATPTGTPTATPTSTPLRHRPQHQLQHPLRHPLRRQPDQL